MKKPAYLIYSTFLLTALLFYSCSTSIVTVKNNFPAPTLKNGFSQPRYVEGELVVHIRNIKILSGDSLKNWNIAHDIPASQPPLLLLWSPDIINRINQRDVKDISYSPKPTDMYLDNENGNRICFWDLTNKLKDGDSITVTRRFSYVAYDDKPTIDKNIVEENWDKIPDSIKSFYTKSEYLLIQTTGIKDTSKKIIEGLTNPLDKAHAIFKWVNDKMNYVYPPKKRGAVEALNTLEGDCGQYSELFIALARAAGIPARQQSGFEFAPGNIDYHVWSEIYLPVYGWVPVDATKKDGFCHIDNTRLIASVGMNIPIKYAPKWATYQNSDVENNRDDFMQLVSTVVSGVEANITTDRILLKSEKK